jgi:hypothetical protein
MSGIPKAGGTVIPTFLSRRDAALSWLGLQRGVTVGTLLGNKGDGLEAPQPALKALVLR